jgi:hypothetical protein
MVVGGLKVPHPSGRHDYIKECWLICTQSFRQEQEAREIEVAIPCLAKEKIRSWRVKT